MRLDILRHIGRVICIVGLDGRAMVMIDSVSKGLQ